MRAAGSCPELIGRSAELGLLADTLTSVRSGRSATVLISGEAGIGKSRLVEEFASLVREAGGRVATGVSTPMEGAGLPYGAATGVLRDLVRQLGVSTFLDTVGPAARELVVLLPTLAPSGAVPVETAEPAKARVFESMLGALGALADAAPTVIVFEDLHWADSATTELIDFLTRNLADARVMIVATFRPEELESGHRRRALLTELGRHGRVVAIELGGLTSEEVSAMVGAVLGRAADRVLAQAVYTRSGGNPFFAEELVAVGDADVLTPELRRISLVRTEELSDDARAVLSAAAVAGVVADHDVLREASGVELQAFDLAVAELVDRHILSMEPNEESYRFRHAITQEAVYDALLPGERRRIHASVGAALSARTVGGPSREVIVDLARHWWASEQWERALTASLDAARDAESLLSYVEARAHLERALCAWDRVPDVAERLALDRLSLLARACDAAYWADAPDRAMEVARIALDDIDADADPATAALWFARLGRSASNCGDLETCLDAFERADAVLPTGQDSPERARALAEAARALMLMSQFSKAEPRAREALGVARAVGARAEEGHAVTTLGCCRAGLGHVEDAVGLLREGLTIALELRSAEGLNRAYGNLTGLMMMHGRPEEAAALVAEGLTVARGIDGAWLGTAATNGARALVRLGRWQDATEMLEGFPGPTPQFSGCAQLSMAAILLRRGDLGGAADALAVADERSAGRQDVSVRGWYHIVAAEVALEQERCAEAFHEIELGLALEAGTDEAHLGPEMRAFAIRALVDGLADAQARRVRFDVDADKARLVVAQLVDEASRIVSAPAERGGTCPPEAAAFAAQCRAEASRLDSSDPNLWDTAADAWAELGYPYERAYCRWREAEALLSGRTGRDRATRSVADAWNTCVGLGAVLLGSRVARLGQRARMTLPSAPADVSGRAADDMSSVASDLGITRREVEVLRCLARGRTDRQIADELFISKKTASVHVSNLLRKLGVVSRIEAGEVGQRVGLG